MLASLFHALHADAITLLTLGTGYPASDLNFQDFLTLFFTLMTIGHLFFFIFTFVKNILINVSNGEVLILLI